MNHFDRSDWEALPLALVGLTQGAFRYFIAKPVAEAVQGWIDGHTMTQEEFDQYLGEQALSLENIKPHSPLS